jgi:hypothetical protein
MIAQQQRVPPRPVRAAAILLAFVALALLGGCQSLAPDAGTADGRWQVVERSGETRFQPPRSATWLPIATGEALPGGSRIATGGGGRLIVARGTDMVMVGPAGQLVLPDEGGGRPALHQAAGELRYRIASGSAPPLRITTAQLTLEAAGGAVFDITAGADSSRVRVLEGRLKVGSRDGARAATLDPGDEAVAAAAARWRVHRDGEAHAAVAPAESEPSPAPAPPPPDPTVRPAGYLRTSPVEPPAEVGEAAGSEPHRMPLAVAAAPPPRPEPERRASTTDPRQIGFERLTAGLLDRLPAQRIKASPRRP